MQVKPKAQILVSACLLGHKTRYDGTDSKDKYVTDKLSKYFDYKVVCPEQMIGLPTPRETLRLIRNPDNQDENFLMSKSGTDLTEDMNSFSEKYLTDLGDNVIGVILKSKSPSCGLGTAKSYQNLNGGHIVKTNGLFTENLLQAYPAIPIIDSGKICDAGLKDRFLTSLFAHNDLLDIGESIHALTNFHASYKYLFMEASPENLNTLGRIIANIKNGEYQEEFQKYKELALSTLNLSLKKGRRINTILHIFGYFKKHISSEEKQEILDLIDSYEEGLIDISNIKTLLGFLAKKYDLQYLVGQKYFEPYPKELAL